MRSARLLAALLLAVPAVPAAAEPTDAPADLAAALADARHAVRSDDAANEFVARSRSQAYRCAFDGRGVAIESAEGWRFELELARFGRTDALVAIDAPVAVEHAGRRAAYRWSGALTEWYVNRDGGLEHGFDLASRPAGAGELIVELALTTDLVPSLTADARTLQLANADGTHACDYAGLVAFDADGADLEARFELDGKRLRIAVDDTGARYPLTIDPIVQSAYIKASNTDVADEFGDAVAVWGDTLVVGARFEDGLSGLNGNDASNGLSNAGAAYVFVRSGGVWTQQAYLKPSSRGVNDYFGISVAVHKNRIVVGASADDSAATGVNGDSGDNSATNAGAAWVFERSGTTWSQVAYLKASNTGSGDQFGRRVAIDGDRIVVGAPFEDSSAVGVDGDGSNDLNGGSGAAYVYRRLLSGWTFESFLKASNPDGDDFFGYDVDISGTTIAVSAWLEDSDANGVGGDQSDDSAQNSGAAYVFVNEGAGWTQQAYVKATNSDAGDLFGTSVALDGDTLVVGAEDESSAATGVNGDQTDNSFDTGAAYVFGRSGQNWFAQAYLKSDEPDENDRFGLDVAISDGTIAIGAPGEDGGGTGTTGSPFDDSALNAGAVFLFTPVGLTWEPRAYLKPAHTDAGDLFGNALALDRESLIVGAPSEDGAGVGVGSNPFDDGAPGSGAAYTFDVGFWELVPGCFANPALILPPARSAYLDSDFRFEIQSTTITTGVAASFYGASGLDASGCGVLVGLGEEVLLGAVPAPKLIGVEPLTSGLASETLVIPDALSLVGIRATVQAVVVDTVTFASEFSQGLEIEVRP